MRRVCDRTNKLLVYAIRYLLSIRRGSTIAALVDKEDSLLKSVARRGSSGSHKAN
jgi:hypothetical protein